MEHFANEIIIKTGFVHLYWGHIVMWLIASLFIWLAIKKRYEPLLLLPIGFGIFLINLPLTPLMGVGEHGERELINYFYTYGIKTEIIPCLIFMGVGALTDFGPMLANPKMLLLGAAAQIGVYITFFGALLLKFTIPEAASIGIIGGADGPTTIYLTTKLAPELLGANALAAYSYMAMVPIIQPPIMRLLTTKQEREIKMRQMRPVSRVEKIVFTMIGTGIVCLLVPPAAPLIGMLFLGNLFRESGVVERLSHAAQNELMNIVTIFLGVSVGATMTAENFLSPQPIFIFMLGLVAFSVSTAGGVLMAKAMNLFLKDKINPLIGAAGVSAVPMAARVVQVEGQKANPKNFLLMHAMAPNVAGVIGTITAAGLFITMLVK
jgi:oxaloacetate decarboxylase beta subunit